MSLITFTSYVGTAGDRIAKEIAGQLNIEFYDDHKLQDRALSIGIASADLEGLNAKAPRLFDRLFTNKPAIYRDLLGSVVYDIASSGQGVIIGHGAQLFLEDFNCALHILVYDSEDRRVAAVSKEYKLSSEAAAKLVRKMDKQTKDFIQHAFNRDLRDFSGYDLVINLEKIGPETAKEMIINLATSNEVKECSLKAITEMKKSSLARKVEAELVRHNLATVYQGLTVEVLDSGKVQLSGIISNKEEANRAVEIVKKVQGVDQVISEIVVIPTPGGI